MKKISSKTQGLLLAIFGFSLIAFADTTIKTTSEYYDAFEVALYTNLATIIFLVPIIFFCGGWQKVMATKSLKFHAIRCYTMLMNFLCIIYALSQLPIPTVYVIVFMMPFILNIMAMVFMKERVSIHRWIAISIGFTGILIALRPDLIIFTPAIFFACMVPLFSSTTTLITKLIDKKDHWLSYTIYLMMFQTPVLIAIVLYRGGSLLPDLTNTPILLWFLAGGAAFAIALSLIPQAIQRIDASVVGSLMYITFPWGVFYGWFLFEDTVDLWTVAGAVIIIASGLFLIYREQVENSKLLKIQKEAEKYVTRL